MRRASTLLLAGAATIWLVACGNSLDEVECTINAECALGQVCISGQCLREDQVEVGVDADAAPDIDEDPDTGTDTPDIGDDTPDTGTDTPDGGTDTPDVGTDTPDVGEDTPDVGEDTPDVGDDTPDVGDDTPDVAPDLPIGVCGDGTVNTGETCDDGADNSDTVGGACRTDCTAPVCGDGVVDPGEQCDDGADNSDTAPNACRTSCRFPSCGDGVADRGAPWREVCDGGDLCSDECERLTEAGRCLNDHDGGAFVDDVAWRTAQSACERACGGLVGGGDRPTCMQSCMAEDLRLTDHCASCWAERAECAAANCRIACATSGPACDTCMATECDLDAATCIGSPWISSPGCRFQSDTCTMNDADYLCIGNSCSRFCREQDNVTADGVACARGTFCYPLATAPGIPADPETGIVVDGACVDSDCSDPTGTTECNGAFSINLGRVCASGECSCTLTPNDATYCMPTGRLAEGSPCGAFDACDDGLSCLHGRCVVACEVGAAGGCVRGSAAAGSCADAGDCACVPGNRNDGRWGACATTCTPASRGECPSDAACIAVGDFGRNGDVTAWTCVPLTRTPLPIGAPCNVAQGVDTQCADGSVCVEGNGNDLCRRTCIPGAPDGSDGDTCGTTQVCRHLGPGFGVCVEGCAPYPQTGEGTYGCPGGLSTCEPFAVVPEDALSGFEGLCQGDVGNAAAFAACPEEGLGSGCEDLGLCRRASRTGARVCHPLCEPFTRGQCPDDSVCSGPSWLSRDLPGFSHCDHQFEDVGPYEPCTREGDPCNEDGTACLDIGDGPFCYPVCRGGTDDCLPWGTACVVGLLPTWDTRPGVGICR